MGFNETPSANRLHIGFFGKRNNGKSSLVNAVTGQKLSIVSGIMGTTTDPVFKAMELLPLGPVVIIDTPGMDDSGELGQMRVDKTYQVLSKTDIAIMVMNVLARPTKQEEELISLMKERNIPVLIAMNKMDLAFEDELKEWASFEPELPKIFVSAKEKTNIIQLIETIGKLASKNDCEKTILGDLVQRGDLVVLVTPIDSSAPKGRLILPQQQVIRNLLDVGAVTVVVREKELEDTLTKLSASPKLVITDSQAFKLVRNIVPDDILLTSFSILFARYKGRLKDQVEGSRAIDNLKDGDRILIAEGCTHHRQCDDIGSVKLPGWISEYTGKKLEIDLFSGTDFPQNLSKYRLVIHCGGCMLNEREMCYRIDCAKREQVPITNYGTAIAYINGILERSLKPFM